MVEVSGATQLLFDWLLSPLIWGVLILIFVAGTVGILYIRKKRKLVYNVIEIVAYGNGKAGFNFMRGGYYGKKKVLRGWFDYGEEQLETQDGDKILNFSTEDFHEYNGKRCIVVARDSVNQDVLAPVNEINIKGMKMLAEIAPAEYRDAALDIINEADRETSDYTKQIVQWVLVGMTIIFSLVSIIVIAQMVKNGQTEASELILEAGQTCLTNAKEVCQSIANTIQSTAP